MSGAIAAGVTMNLTGAATATTTTATGGTYTFAGLANGSYTVTPSLSGYTFSPTSIAVTISGANQTGKNFTSTAVTGDTPLTSGVGVAGSVALQAWKYYTIVVPSGATNLAITLTGLSRRHRPLREQQHDASDDEQLLRPLLEQAARRTSRCPTPTRRSPPGASGSTATRRATSP